MLSTQLGLPRVFHHFKATGQPRLNAMDWAAIQGYLEDRLPGNFAVYDEQAFDDCVELTNDI